MILGKKLQIASEGDCVGTPVCVGVCGGKQGCQGS